MLSPTPAFDSLSAFMEALLRLYLEGQRNQWEMARLWQLGKEAFGADLYASVPDMIFDGYSTRTLDNLAWVWRNVPEECRVYELPFSFHAVVAPSNIPDEVKKSLLERAYSEGWSRQSLTEERNKYLLLGEGEEQVTKTWTPLNAREAVGFAIRALEKPEEADLKWVIETLRRFLKTI